jgi:hypothetical protein
MKRGTKLGGEGQSEPREEFVGGMRYGMGNYTIPLVRLELYEDRLQVRSNFRFLRRIIPRVELRFSEISIVEPVGNALGSGVRISVRGAGDSIVFWTGSIEKMLSVMKRYGLPVVFDRKRFHFTDPER